LKLDRRAFIRLIPVVAVAVASGSWWFLTQTAREPMMTSQATVTTSETSQATPTSLTAFDFPVTWNGDRVTKVDSNEYRLRIDGDVSKPLELTLEELYAMSNIQENLEIQCVEGWAADVLWDGIPLSYLLSRAGASLKNIAHVTVESITGYSTTLSSDEVANSDNIIALKAGGAPLTLEHGYPARLLAPTRSGLHWVKCVGRITCTNK
jgi:DMSO/TMAO reductase YedYZ molybdopterin-dependent catalytic subunit